MNFRTIIVIFLSVVCGVASAVSVNRLRPTEDQPVEQVSQAETVPVVVTAVDVPLIGTLLGPEMIKVVQWPKEFAPEGVFTKAEDVIGKSPNVPLLQGELLLAGKLEEGLGLSYLLQKPNRGFTISTPSASAQVAGFIRPTDRVDIYLTRETDESFTGGTATTMLLQDVEVIAVGEVLSAPGQRAATRMSNITLSVSQDQAGILTSAQTNGTFTVALRAKEDHDIVKTKPWFWSDVAGLQSFKPVTAEIEEPADTAPTLKARPLQVKAFRGKTSGSIVYQPM